MTDNPDPSAELYARLDRVRQAIDAAGAEGISKSAIWAMFTNSNRHELAGLLRELLRDGRYECVQQRTQGRPALMYRAVCSPVTGQASHEEKTVTRPADPPPPSLQDLMTAFFDAQLGDNPAYLIGKLIGQDDVRRGCPSCAPDDRGAYTVFAELRKLCA